ncbi:MAG: AMP-binding protein, partial [Firmicutes bacterium]|nr:AMP-binding protein [Bacillota bacterium]
MDQHLCEKDELAEMASRIREMREVSGFSIEYMAEQTEVSIEDYQRYESGTTDLPFTFIHKCALAFDMEITDLLEGQSASLSSYTLTRKGGGPVTAKEEGILISNLAPMFRNKIAEPYWVTYSYSPELQNKPIHTTTHSGQEFDLVLSGQLKVRVGEHTEVLNEGDSIYYNSSTPHGMIAVGGRDCVFCAVVLPGEKTEEKLLGETIVAAKQSSHMVYENFIDVVEDENGALQSISFKNDDKFNFAFDVVDAIAKRSPDKLAMLHLDREKNERRFTFEDISRHSNRAANYFKSLGIKKGDRVMLVLRRNYQFWISVIALHKLGAIIIPAT